MDSNGQSNPSNQQQLFLVTYFPFKNSQLKMDIEIHLKSADSNGFFMDRLFQQPDILHQMPSSPKGNPEALFFC